MKQPRCVKCGKPLKDPVSIAIGMGPDCRGGMGRRGWKFPKPKWRVHRGHAVLDEVQGKVEPPVVMTTEDKEIMRRLEKRKAEHEHHNEHTSDDADR